MCFVYDMWPIRRSLGVLEAHDLLINPHAPLPRARTDLPCSATNMPIGRGTREPPSRAALAVSTLVVQQNRETSGTRGKREDQVSTSKEMPFLDHLEELRWRIIRSGLAIAVGSIIGIVVTIRFDLIEVLTAPLFSVVRDLSAVDPGFLGLLETERLVFLNLTEPFFFVLRLGVSIGVVHASPVVVHQIWAFLAAALDDRERRAIVPTFVLGLFLFAAGVAMAYFVALPMTIRFLLMFGS